MTQNENQNVEELNIPEQNKQETDTIQNPQQPIQSENYEVKESEQQILVNTIETATTNTDHQKTTDFTPFVLNCCSQSQARKRTLSNTDSTESLNKNQTDSNQGTQNENAFSTAEQDSNSLKKPTKNRRLRPRSVSPATAPEIWLNLV